MTDQELMHQALEALDSDNPDIQLRAAAALRLAIEQAERQEPYAWAGLEPSDMPDGEDPMYDHPFFIQGIVWAATKLLEKNAAPPQRQPLTDEEKAKLCKQFPDTLTFNAIHAIERAHGIGGGE
jgi:hypothetical protein